MKQNRFKMVSGGPGLVQPEGAFLAGDAARARIFLTAIWTHTVSVFLGSIPFIPPTGSCQLDSTKENSLHGRQIRFWSADPNKSEMKRARRSGTLAGSVQFVWRLAGNKMLAA